MSDNQPVWSVPIDVEDVADTGMHLDNRGAAEDRAALAETVALRDVKRLRATFDLTKHGPRVDVIGQVKATVGQTCVVTLEPIDNEIEEAVDLVFAPMSAGATAAPRSGGQRKGDDEPPEPIIDGVIDLGAIASEFLMLGNRPLPAQDRCAIFSAKGR